MYINELSLNGMVVVISGGAGLLGQSLVKALLQEGATVIIADINRQLGVEFCREVGLSHKVGRVKFEYVNIVDVSSIDSLVNKVAAEYGRIDGLINCAYPRNKNYGKNFEDVEYHDFCENINTHLGGYFLTTQQFIKYFLSNGGGAIVNIASIYGFIAPRFEIYSGTNMTMPVEYAMAKSALIQLTRYLAKYYKGRNIRINSISPGGILDSQPENFLKSYNAFSSSKGMLKPEDIQGALLFLLSNASRYVNGQNIVVDDGWTL